MKIKRIAIYAAIAFMLLCVGIRQAGAVQTISAPFVITNVGELLTIPISITGAVDLTSWQFDLGFNPSVVLALSFTDSGTDFETAATSQGGFLTGITGVILSNQFSLLADSMSGLISGSGLQGSGSLVFLEFQALAPGVSPLTFSNVFLNFSDQSFAISNGQITVIGPSPITEPATIVLLTTGLALLVLRRLISRRRREF